MKSGAAELAGAAAEHLQAAVRKVSFLRTGVPVFGHRSDDSGVDFTLPVEVRGRRWTLACAVKRSGQPRFVREGAFQLGRHLRALAADQIYGIFVAPYLSEESTALLREEGVGYLDFAGNCLLSFDGIFVERSGSPHTPERRRKLREVFAPKASRVLRVLFSDPHRSWRVTELAERAAVSLGQVSNVRRALLDREWASSDSQGLKLQKPGMVLDAWREVYVPRLAAEKQYYTLLHGEALTAALKSSFAALATGAHLSLASFSAAQWLAPFARVAGTHLYADEVGLEALQEEIKLQHAPRGANVTVAIPKDDSVFMDSYEPIPGLRCTGALQTYLDLWQAGDRGQEAAEQIRQTRLESQWSAP